jgi:hypothetical protein
VDTPWPRVASPQHASPRPPLRTSSIAVAAPTRLTRSRVLAPPAAIDTVDIFPRTPPQARTQCVVARPSPTSPSRALASPGGHLPSPALTLPLRSPEQPRHGRPELTPAAPRAAIKREQPWTISSHSLASLSLLILLDHPSPSIARRSSPNFVAGAAEDLRSSPTNWSPIGDATGTSALAVVYNIDLQQRRRSPTSQLAADPRAAAAPASLPPVDDDDAQPPDHPLILRLTIKGTDSVEVSH